MSCTTPCHTRHVGLRWTMCIACSAWRTWEFCFPSCVGSKKNSWMFKPEFGHFLFNPDRKELWSLKNSPLTPGCAELNSLGLCFQLWLHVCECCKADCISLPLFETVLRALFSIVVACLWMLQSRLHFFTTIWNSAKGFVFNCGCMSVNVAKQTAFLYHYLEQC